MNRQLRIASLLATAILMSYLSMNAQNNALLRGNVSIGSGVGYANSVSNIQIESGGGVTQGENQAYQLHLTPSIGYFLGNNFVVGLGMDYVISSSRNDGQNNTINAQTTSDTKLLFGPYSRIYFPFAGDQAFFLGGVYGYGKSDTELSAGGETQKVNTTLMTWGAGPGYTIFSSRGVALEAQVKYNYGISRNVFLLDGSNQSTRTRTRGWDFVVGMHFYFARNNNNNNRSVE